MTLHRRSFAEYLNIASAIFFSIDEINFNLSHFYIHSSNCKLDEFMCKIQHIGATFHVMVVLETWIADELERI